MVLVRFAKPWGSYKPGDCLNVPAEMAAALERDGTVTTEGKPAPAAVVERATDRTATRTADAPPSR